MTTARVAALARLDDEALTVLASTGLLRRARKDLARTTPELRDDGEVLRVVVADHEVVVGEGGIAAATCTCPSPGTCQHVLAVALHARGLVPPGGAAGDDGPDEHGADERRSAEVAADGVGDPSGAAENAVGRLVAVAAEELLAHAGRAGYRWAHDVAVDLDLAGEVGVRADPTGAVTVTVLRPRVTVRWVGGPWQDAVCSPGGTNAPRTRVAALLALRRASGADVPPPPGPAGRAQRAGTAAERATAADGSRERLREAAGALLLDCVALGLAHLSDGVRERAETLAVWAQTAGYHRVARLLRAVADQVDQLLRRQAAADTSRLLDTLATGHALLAALDLAERAAQQGGPAVPVGLTGRARGRFADVDRLDVVGLGGLPWRSATGFVGLTTFWWCPERTRVLTCTDARPETLRGFDPRERWTQPGPWSGLSSPSAAAGRLLRLGGARLSDDGRLSASEQTTVSTLAGDGGPASLGPEPLEHWPDARRALPAASVLADPAGTGVVVVLRPAATAPPTFDRARQVLTWPLVDRDGEVLTAEVAWGTYGAAAVRYLETAGRDLPPGALVCGRLRSRAGAAVLEPVSVIEAASAGPVVTSVHLPDADAPRAGAGARATTTPAAAPPPGTQPSGDAGTDELVPVPAPLAALRGWAVATAERGTSPAAVAPAWQEVTRLRRRAADAGLTALPDPTTTPVDDPRRTAATLLRLHAVLLQHERLLGRPGEV